MLLSYDLCALYRAEPRVYGTMMGDDDSEVSVQYGVHTYMGVVLFNMVYIRTWEWFCSIWCTYVHGSGFVQYGVYMWEWFCLCLWENYNISSYQKFFLSGYDTTCTVLQQTKHASNEFVLSRNLSQECSKQGSTVRT